MDPTKIASGVSVGGGLGVWLTSLTNAIKGNEGSIGLLIAFCGLLVQVVYQARKEKREAERALREQDEHQARMLLLEIQIEEEEGAKHE